jgi:excisionase family DNA binding protein
MVQGDYITTAEVAKLLKISLSTAQKLAREGKLPALKVGKLWRFTAQGPAILLYKLEQKAGRRKNADAAQVTDNHSGLKGFLKLAADVGVKEPFDREPVDGGRA